MGSGASTRTKYDTPGESVSAPSVNLGHTSSLRYGSQTVLVNGADGRAVQVGVPSNHVSGHSLPRSSAPRSQEQEIIDFIRILEKDADSARMLAHKNLSHELQLQKALWASTQTQNTHSVGLLDQLQGVNEQPEHVQALVVAAAMDGDAAQLLAALEEAKRVSEVSTSLELAAKELHTAEEGLLTWRCLREALQAQDRPEIQAWLEQAMNMGFDAPEGVYEYLDTLYKKEHAHLQNLERRREAERRLKFAQEAGEPELLAQMEAEAAALGIRSRPSSFAHQSPRASPRQRSSVKHAKKEKVRLDTGYKHEDRTQDQEKTEQRGEQRHHEQEGSRERAQEEKQEHEQRQEQEDHQEQNNRQREQREGAKERPRVTVKAKVRVNTGRPTTKQTQGDHTQQEQGQSSHPDTRSIKELLDECRQRGLDTTACTTREDLLDLLQRSREAESGGATGASARAGDAAQATRKATVKSGMPLPASVWDRQKIPAQHQVHKQYEAMYLLGFDITKLKGMPTAAELRSAYRKAAMESHPDKVQNHDRQTEAKELFQRVRAAFDYLCEVT